MAFTESQNGTAALPVAPAPDDWPAPASDVIFRGPVGHFVETIEPHTEADPVAMALQFLCGFGNMAGRAVYKVADGAPHYPNLFAKIVGATAKARKGTSWAQVIRSLKLVDPGWARRCVQSGLSSGEGLIYAVRDLIEKEIEGKTVAVDKGVDDKRLLPFEAEFVSVLKVCQREQNTLSALLRQAWDHGNLRTLTKNSPTQATGAHISIVGHITRDELKRTFTATESANGFGNRFIWIAAKRSKLLPEGGDLQDSAFAGLVLNVRRALDAARKPREIKFDQRARDVWWQIYPDLSRDRSGLMGAILARAEAQVVRLALVYALLDCATEIRIEHLESALGLWQYSEASAKWIFGDALGDPDADTILNALRSQPSGLTRTEISNLFGRNLSASRIDRALAVLLSAKRAAFIPEKTNGRPTERWRAIRSE